MKTDAWSQLPHLKENLSQLTSSAEPLWHPLGFVSCVVRNEKQKFTTRVHYWPKDERRSKNPNWPIHTHAYDLSSLVLEGRVRDIQYRQTEGSNYVIYSVSYAGDDSSINRTGKSAAIEVTVDSLRKAGDQYSVPVGAFHQSLVPTDEEAITLVAISNFRNVDPFVLGTKEAKSYPYDRVPFSRSIFWDRASEAIERFHSR